MPKKHYGKPFNEYKKPSGSKPSKPKPTASKPSKPSKPTKKPPKRIVRTKPKDGVDLSGQTVIKRTGKRKTLGSGGIIANRQKKIANRVAKMFKNKKR